MREMHCEDCLAYYPEDFDHVCPPWLKELVAIKKRKEVRVKDPIAFIGDEERI
jgi:alkyl hydroperoxide reductase subunit AhpC